MRRNKATKTFLEDEVVEQQTQTWQVSTPPALPLLLAHQRSPSRAPLGLTRIPPQLPRHSRCTRRQVPRESRYLTTSIQRADRRINRRLRQSQGQNHVLRPHIPLLARESRRSLTPWFLSHAQRRRRSPCWIPSAHLCHPQHHGTSWRKSYIAGSWYGRKTVCNELLRPSPSGKRYV